MMVTVTGLPTVAVLLAVSVSTCVPAEPAAKAAVTPLGRPEALRPTLPLNPPAPVTVMISVALEPCVTDTEDGFGTSVKLGGTFTVSAIVVDAVSVPAVPAMVTVTGDVVAVAELLAVRVTTLELVAGLVANNAVTPLGRPDTASVTPLANPPTPVTVRVLDAVLP